MKISIVVPCYNEQESLPLLYSELIRVLEQTEYSYELILIDDGSTDRTLSVMKQLSGQDENVIYLALSRNFGKEAAMYAGLCNAGGDYVTVMDADLQDPPSLLPRMAEILAEGEYSCVAAYRTDRTGEPPVRSWFSRRFYGLMNRFTDAEILPGARDYRMMTRQMAETIRLMGEQNRFSKGIFGWVGFSTYWLPYENVARAAGQTKWSFWKLFRYGCDGILNFSNLPLYLASWLGFFLTAIAFIMLVFVVVRRVLFGDPVAGWASTICVIVFIGGIQLFCLGIMGQYIARIYTESKRRPHFIVAESNRRDATFTG